MKSEEPKGKKFRAAMILSKWGDVVRHALYNLCRDQKVHQHPYDYCAENILIVTRKSLDKWLTMEITEWQVKAVRAIQEAVKSALVDEYISETFQRSAS